ncbi:MULTISPECIES: hypothetical protein [unclassified Coleofasciculus]|uniref:hypothetical protein n=1 Tax=unclassified Coleofasciculus TaxID=2692782 RepID=UPI0018811310|nr:MULTISPECIES: hypothetical protein [unclassified Coleofasciculus]MBE9126518.1 hypothetical protein [Coleofasciculus sp. LEGE 07081]MBE9149952.1 hypothetical protein [Coleofasciculus sp. LEGE 07092]
MTHSTRCSDTEGLETIFNTSESNLAKKTPRFSKIKSIWRQTIKAWATRNEPRIWQSRDRFGKTCWHGYDPVTGRSVSRSSESEMRIWLEEY